MSELAHLLSAECFAERYALTLRLMLANFRRKTGALSTVPGTPRLSGQPTGAGTLPTQPGKGNGAVGDFEGGLQSLLSLPQMGEGFDGMPDGNWNLGEEVEGFAWPTEFSPSNLPVWLQDGVSRSLPYHKAVLMECSELYGSRPSARWLGFAIPPARVGEVCRGNSLSSLTSCSSRLASMFLPSGTMSNAGYQFALPDSGDVGAEAW